MLFSDDYCVGMTCVEKCHIRQIKVILVDRKYTYA